MIDTHAHLDFSEFDGDREEVIRRAFDGGVEKIINVGVDLETSKKSIALAEEHENIFAAVGFHPDFFQDLRFKIYDLRKDLRELAGNNKVVAIGEVGLDYFSHTNEIISDTQKENQKKGLLAQIKLAKELNLPVIMHCRDAWEDLYEIISNYYQSQAFLFREPGSRNSPKPGFSKFVLHCYSGEKKDTKKLLEIPNVFFSFSANITYPKPAKRSAKLTEAVRMVPLERMMLDSDAPFLAPQEYRGKRNEPAYIQCIAEKIAQIKQISAQEVKLKTSLNAKNFFGV